MRYSIAASFSFERAFVASSIQASLSTSARNAAEIAAT